MKIDHLTFAQLHKLKDESTLMRVTAAYHKALRRRWNANPNLDPALFTVVAAENQGSLCDYSKFAAPWRRVLAFLRSSDLKSALRLAAKQEYPQPGEWRTFRVLSRRGFPNRKIRWALGALIVTHCKNNGISATWCEDPDTLDFEVLAATDDAGIALLEWRPGLRWETIQTFCAEMGTDPNQVFWWLSWTDDKTGWRINPCNWPVNTPDYQETAKELVEK